LLFHFAYIPPTHDYLVPYSLQKSPQYTFQKHCYFKIIVGIFTCWTKSVFHTMRNTSYRNRMNCKRLTSEGGVGGEGAANTKRANEADASTGKPTSRRVLSQELDLDSAHGEHSRVYYGCVHLLLRCRAN